MAVYSERLLRVWTHSALVSYEVPSGLRAVVRCITLVNLNTAAGRAEVNAGGIPICGRSVPGREHIVIGDLRAVVYAGETILGYSYLSDLMISVHGYLFADAASGSIAGRVLEVAGSREPPMIDPEVKG